MPEGPEIYITAQFLKANIVNKYFNDIYSNSKNKVVLPLKSKVIDVFSYGKFAIIKTNDYYVTIHLGLTGWIVKNKPKIYKYVFYFDDIILYLNDTRRFSSIKIYNEIELKKKISELGVDILTKDFTYDYFLNFFKKSSKYICSLLLDQKIFAGIGNYIKVESLYLAKILPYKKTFELSTDKIKLLYSKIKLVAFSSLVSLHNIYDIEIDSKLKKMLPKYLEIPYKFYIYDREKDDNNFDVILDKNHCGRRTFYVKEIQL